MTPKRHDPITYRYPRTMDAAFGYESPVELPKEPSLLRWWGEVFVALNIVLFCIFVVKVIA
jgi:hypothetical protein